MSPPPTAALAFLGAWGLMVFWATSATATTQTAVDNRFDGTALETEFEESERSERSFSTADD